MVIFVPVLIAAAASYLCTDSLCGLDVDALGGAIEGERRETDEEVAVTGGRGAGSFNRGDWGALASRQASPRVGVVRIVRIAGNVFDELAFLLLYCIRREEDVGGTNWHECKEGRADTFGWTTW